MFKLAAIFCVWDDYEMLEHARNNIRPLVDGIIIIDSCRSNYGEDSQYNIVGLSLKGDHHYNREPQFTHPMNSEMDKRNFGLQKARELGYTHFLMMDADEFYHPKEFLQAKEMFNVNPDLAGLVCPSRVYFKSPTLTIGLDTTLVPFIHKITPTLKHEFNKLYPFAWSRHEIKIDPTRSLNINSGVEMCDIVMEHYSWVRRDYKKKIRNSTARANIEKSTIMEDLLLAKDGYFCKFYGKILHTVPNYFNLPEYDVLV